MNSEWVGMARLQLLLNDKYDAIQGELCRFGGMKLMSARFWPAWKISPILLCNLVGQGESAMTEEDDCISFNAVSPYIHYTYYNPRPNSRLWGGKL